MKKFKQLCRGLGMIGAVALLATGCSKDEAKQVGNESKNTEKPLEISIFFPGTTDSDRNEMKMKGVIEEATNTKITCVEAPGGEWQQKLTMLFSSGSEPNLIFLDGGYTSTMNKFASEGFLHPVEEVLENMPNAKKYVTEDLRDKLLSGDGKLYMLPAIRDVGNGALFIREDWLNNLGLEAPKTLDEYYDVLKAFTFNDPDGNGKNDTYGFITGNEGDFDAFAGLYGLPVGQWMIQGDELVYSSINPKMKDALAFATKIYKEGLVHPESITIKNKDEKISAGQAGIWHGVSSGASRMNKALLELDPNAKCSVLSTPIASGIEKGYASTARIVREEDGNPMQLVSVTGISKNVKDKDLNRYAGFLDWHFTPEGNAALTYGIEGETYTKSGDSYGDYEFLSDVTLDDLYKMGTWDKFHYVGYIPQRRHYDQLWDKQTGDNMRNTPKNAWAKQIYFSTSMGDKISADVEKKRIEIFQQVVAGTISVDEGWNKWLSEFDRFGGQEWIKEMNKEYNARKSN